MKDLFDLFSENDYSRIRRADDTEPVGMGEIDDTDEADINELVELDIEKGNGDDDDSWDAV